MRAKRFCRICGKQTAHDKRVDLIGTLNWSGGVERLFLGLVTMGASEVFADRYFECEECGKVTRA